MAKLTVTRGLFFVPQERRKEKGVEKESKSTEKNKEVPVQTPASRFFVASRKVLLRDDRLDNVEKLS